MATWTNDENKWGNTKFSITKTASADQSNQQVLAGVTGKSIYITDVIVFQDTPSAGGTKITLHDDTGNLGSGAIVAAIFRLSSLTVADFQSHSFNVPIQIAAGKDLDWTSDTNGTTIHGVTVNGYIQ